MTQINQLSVIRRKRNVPQPPQSCPGLHARRSLWRRWDRGIQYAAAHRFLPRRVARPLPVVLLCRTSSGLTKSVNPKYSPTRPASHEGRTRRHEREAGCDGRYRAQSTKRARRVRRSRVVPTPRRRCQGLGQAPRPTVARTPGTPRRARYKSSNIAQGVPAVPAALSLLACAKCTFFCTQGSRVRPASGAPCALMIERADEDASPGQSCRGNAEACRK
jgi:hypothetical protein